MSREIRNPKSEIRNGPEAPAAGPLIRSSSFEPVSDFVFRISDLAGSGPSSNQKEAS
jgi:hypothetical protein